MPIDLLGLDPRSRSFPVSSAAQGFMPEGAGAGLGDTMPPMERPSARPGMFGNPRAAALAAPQQATEPGMGITAAMAAPISLTPADEMPMQTAALPALQPLPDVQPKKPAFFGKNGLGWDILGTIGDALSAAGGGQATYLPMKLAMRRHEQALEDEARRQTAQWELWKRQQDYTWANRPREPRQPHYWESNDGSLMALGDDGKPVKVYADPTPKMNFVPDGMGGGQWVAVPTSGPTTPSNRPKIGAVIADPRRGGGSGDATGGFR